MVGMNLAFFPQFIMGARGLAAGVPQNEGYVGGLQSVSGVGMVLLLVGLAITAWNLVRSMMNGPVAGVNPWGASTLEWQDEVPAEAGDPYNF